MTINMDFPLSQSESLRLQTNRPQDQGQPLHPSVRVKLHPRYVDFHDKNLASIAPRIFVPWQDSYRERLFPSAGDFEVPWQRLATWEPSYQELGSKLKCYRPKWTTTPLPILLWFQSGGWCCAKLTGDENTLAAIAISAECVVVSVLTRQAPQHPYPVPVRDGYEAWETIRRHAHDFGGREDQIFIAGASSGGNIAAAVTLTCAHRSTPLPRGLVLIAPVLDNTAEHWDEKPHAPWLPSETMKSFRALYVPDEETHAYFDVSPARCPDSLLQGPFPATRIMAMGEDILETEAIQFGRRLQEHGHPVKLTSYPGLPHHAFSMGTLLPHVVEDLVALLKRDFSLLQTSTSKGESSDPSEITDSRNDANRVSNKASRAESQESRNAILSGAKNIKGDGVEVDSILESAVVEDER